MIDQQCKCSDNEEDDDDDDRDLAQKIAFKHDLDHHQQYLKSCTTTGESINQFKIEVYIFLVGENIYNS